MVGGKSLLAILRRSRNAAVTPVTAAPPRAAMNSRRFMLFLPLKVTLIDAENIALNGGAAERANNWPGRHPKETFATMSAKNRHASAIYTHGQRARQTS
jgi:hypothetical protein